MEKSTVVLRETDCTYTELCHYVMADVTHMDLQWSNFNALKMDYNKLILDTSPWSFLTSFHGNMWTIW